MLPNFVCPGAQKAATSTLFHVLRQHPQVYLPACKETHFFDKDELYGRGVAWYEATFYADAGAASAVGDVTPKYMFLPEVPARMRAALGAELKLVFMLRDPVARAYSHYWMRRGAGGERRDFRRAVEDELRRLAAMPEEDPERYATDAYVNRGYYAQQLGRFLARFPRENMHFVLFEELVADPRAAMQAVFRFLELPEVDGLDYEIHSNPAQAIRSPLLHDLIKGKRSRTLGRLLVPIKPLRRVFRRKRDEFYRAAVIRGFNRKAIEKPRLEEDLRLRLQAAYDDDKQALERILGRSLDLWWPSPIKAPRTGAGEELR